MRTDLTYREEGLFVTYYPNTEDGIVAWRDMINLSPDARFLSIHRKQINAQLKAAGYSVRKSPIRGKIGSELLISVDSPAPVPILGTSTDARYDDRPTHAAKKYYKPIFL